MNYPNFFDYQSTQRDFETVLTFIHSNFEVNDWVSFRIWDKVNSEAENQRALIVFAYAQTMNYTFNQVKALFAEHDHFAIALPESRKWRNILEFNKIFSKLLQEWEKYHCKINDFSDYFDVPNNILTLKE